MATYSSLTPTQQQQLADNDLAIRPLIGDLARLVAKANAVTAAYAEIAGPIVSTLGSTELIPNASSFAGSVELQAYDTGALIGYLSALAATWDAAHTNLAIKAVGAINTVVG